MGDNEFETNISRVQYKQYMDESGLSGKFQDMLLQTKDAMDEQGLKLDIIEFVGEGTRMPYIETELMDIFYMYEEVMQRTLNT